LTLSSDDVRELELYFGPAGGGGKSTLGPQLDRAQALYCDSEGHVIDTRRIVLVNRELAARASDGAPLIAQVLSPWPYIPVHREQGGSGAEPEDHDEDLQLAARVSRRLAQIDADSRWVLARLYGDAGCRWQRGTWGRVWALVPYTTPAHRALAKDDASRIAKGQPRASLDDAERLASLALPRPRPLWVDSALRDADRQRTTAERVWARTG